MIASFALLDPALEGNNIHPWDILENEDFSPQNNSKFVSLVKKVLEKEKNTFYKFHKKEIGNK